MALRDSRLMLMLPLLLATLLLRGLVPAGWMPTAVGGGVVMTLCNGGGTRGIDPGHAPAPAEAPCAFAGLAPLFHADPPLLPAPATIVLPLAAGPAPVIPAAARRPWPLPPSQGPPSRRFA